MKPETNAKTPRRARLEWLAETGAMLLGAIIILAIAWRKHPGLTYCGMLLYGWGKVNRVAHRSQQGGDPTTR